MCLFSYADIAIKYLTLLLYILISPVFKFHVIVVLNILCFVLIRTALLKIKLLYYTLKILLYILMHTSDGFKVS